MVNGESGQFGANVLQHVQENAVVLDNAKNVTVEAKIVKDHLQRQNPVNQLVAQVIIQLLLSLTLNVGS